MLQACIIIAPPLRRQKFLIPPLFAVYNFTKQSARRRSNFHGADEKSNRLNKYSDDGNRSSKPAV